MKTLLNKTQREKSMFDQLTVLRNPVGEDDLVQVITNGLGSQYRPFIRSLENRPTDVTFDDLYGLLLSEKTNLNAENIKTDAYLITFYTAYNSSRGRGTKGNFHVIRGGGQQQPYQYPPSSGRHFQQ